MSEWERRRWQWWEDKALLRGVNELLKDDRNDNGKHYIEEWWFVYQHEKCGGIAKSNCNNNLLFQRTGSECYRRYLELNMEPKILNKVGP